MSEPNQSHDKLAIRLTHILIKLNEGEKLDSKKLAEELNVSLRTIQRDFNDRFSYLPLIKEQGCFSLESYYLGKLNRSDINRFASLAGIKSLFPALDGDFLRELFDSRIQQAYLIKGHHYEDLSSKTKTFSELEQAIVSHYSLAFQYKSKCYREVEPYKLINHKGIWYLAAKHQLKLKTFCFSEVERLEVSEVVFVYDEDVEARIQQEDSIWFGEKREVVLKVDVRVAHYFKRRSLIPNQQIDKQLEDGGLIISSRISDDVQILPLIRYWLPHVEVISPNDLRDKLLLELRNYLTGKESC